MNLSSGVHEKRSFAGSSSGHRNEEDNLLDEMHDQASNPGPYVAINRPVDSQCLPIISNMITDESLGPRTSHDRRSTRQLHSENPQATTELESRVQAIRPIEEDSPRLSQFNPLESTLCRDILLSYVQRDYLASVKPNSSRLAPVPIHRPNTSHSLGRDGDMHALLTVLRTFHPTHLPTLLLLGCLYFTSGDLDLSLEINQDILRLEPNHIEAMCNIGCIMKAMNKPEAAYEWWWKALRSQPMYWDVTDNLLDLILESRSSGQSDVPMINKRALEVCEFVLSSLVDETGHLRGQVPPEQLFRFQNMYCTRANLLHTSTERYVGQALDSYSHAIDLALMTQPIVDKDSEQVSFRDLITATCISALFLMDESMIPKKIARLLGFDGKLDLRRPGFSILHTVQRLGNRLISALHEIGFDVLPLILLEPEQIEHLPRLLFAASRCVLPSNCTRDSSGTLTLLPESVRVVTNKVSSKVILMIAKHFHEALAGATLVDGTFQSSSISTSLVLVLYYLALAIFPSAIAYNNLGAMISTLGSSMILSIDGQRKTVGTEHFITAFYRRGLQLDPTHAHLLTNLGSALKEKGDVSDAIRLYSKAIEMNPELDVALVNLGNALRDAGRPWDSIQFYQRALDIKPLPDATCGLASTLSAICDWRGRGWLQPELGMVQTLPACLPHEDSHSGWIRDLVATCEQQLREGYAQNIGLLRRTYTLQQWLQKVQSVYDRPLCRRQWDRWEHCLRLFYTEFDHVQRCVNEGGYVVRLVEWLSRGLQRRWYIESYGQVSQFHSQDSRPKLAQQDAFTRPLVPSIGHFPVPALLPFHTLAALVRRDPRTIRLISHRNALRISYDTLTQSWLPQHVYPPPPPPYMGRLNIGYVSRDFTDHPLAHLVQSIFKFHDPEKFNVHVYATSQDDGSLYRQKIAKESPAFLDVSSWKLDAIVNRIVDDQIHILINLGGFARGSKNDIFAARPCPVQILMMGFPGSLGAGWCDYLVGDVISCPKDMRRDSGSEDDDEVLDVGVEPDPEGPASDWIFTEKIIYMPVGGGSSKHSTSLHTFMVTDHKQSFNRGARMNFEEEEEERLLKRRTIFTDLTSDTFIFANFNQGVPGSILWLLRFPAAGEEHLKRTARAWANEEVASRIRFTDVAPKEEHVQRGRVADLFLDTAEAWTWHSVLWSGTPIVTWPKHRHKMCSRVGASIANATGFGEKMIVESVEEYKERAIFLAIQHQRVKGDADGTESELTSLRRDLHRNRYTMPLFDTERWTLNFEKACWVAWKRWVAGVDLLESKSDITVTDSGEIKR
ncbi:hypothetical protein D9615_002508 [Tricholomella constricta]|uniref:protein O-GlcNAc transferase n=1 Tax=Tricholomella constricta TaxID=117010 RepID=A0A8H5HME2_9AGAR|nr:hypothetical protein D9615_002508 [Tricholomella constricta]